MSKDLARDLARTVVFIGAIISCILSAVWVHYRVNIDPRIDWVLTILTPLFLISAYIAFHYMFENARALAKIKWALLMMFISTTTILGGMTLFEKGIADATLASDAYQTAKQRYEAAMDSYRSWMDRAENDPAVKYWAQKKADEALATANGYSEQMNTVTRSGAGTENAFLVKAGALTGWGFDTFGLGQSAMLSILVDGLLAFGLAMLYLLGKEDSPVNSPVNSPVQNGAIHLNVKPGEGNKERILALLDEGNLNQKEIAEKVGVAESYVSRVKKQYRGKK